VRIFYIVVPLVIVALVFIFLIFYKKVLARRRHNLFSGGRVGYFGGNSFLKGVLQSFIFDQDKRAVNDSGQELGFSLGKSGGKDISGEGAFGKISNNRVVTPGQHEDKNILGVRNSERIKESKKKLERTIKKDKTRVKKIRGYENIESAYKKKETVNTTGSKLEVDENEFSKKKNAKNKLKKGRGSSIDPKRVLKEMKKTEVGLILNSLKKEQYSFLIDKLAKLNFKTKKEFVKTLLEELVNLLREATKELKYRSSKIRKTGTKIKGIDLKLMTIPLKIKVFMATYKKKDFDKVVSIMGEIDREIKPLEVKLKSEKEVMPVQMKKKNS